MRGAAPATNGPARMRAETRRTRRSQKQSQREVLGEHGVFDPGPALAPAFGANNLVFMHRPGHVQIVVVSR